MQIFKITAAIVGVLLAMGAATIVMGAPSFEVQGTGVAMPAAFSQEPAKPSDEKEENNDRVAEAIAKEFKVTTQDILKLHSDGWGYGEIVKAYALAKETGKSVDAILAMKKDGKGWGEIETTLGVKPGKLDPNLGEIMRDASGGKSGDKTKDAAPGKSGEHRQDDKEKDKGKGKGK